MDNTRNETLQLQKAIESAVWLHEKTNTFAGSYADKLTYGKYVCETINFKRQIIIVNNKQALALELSTQSRVQVRLIRKQTRASVQVNDNGWRLLSPDVRAMLEVIIMRINLKEMKWENS